MVKNFSFRDGFWLVAGTCLGIVLGLAIIFAWGTYAVDNIIDEITIKEIHVDINESILVKETYKIMEPNFKKKIAEG